MQMQDRLARARADVVDGAIPVLDVTLARDLSCDQLAIADQFRILGPGLSEIDNVPFGDDQDVRRRLRIDVLKGQGPVVFVDLLAGEFARDNLAEQTVTHWLAHAFSPVPERNLECE